MKSLPTLNLRDTIARRLENERGTIVKDAPVRVALTYPSPYAVGMSSLGFQTIYRELNGRPDTVAERAFCPDDLAEARRAGEGVVSYESRRPLADFPIVAISVAYENELGNMIETLELGGIPALSEDRVAGRHPFVLAGGPLTFSNPVPLAPFADAVIMGEAEDVIHRAIDVLASENDHAARLRMLAEIPSIWVPAIHGEPHEDRAGKKRERPRRDFVRERDRGEQEPDAHAEQRHSVDRAFVRARWIHAAVSGAVGKSARARWNRWLLMRLRAPSMRLWIACVAL